MTSTSNYIIEEAFTKVYNTLSLEQCLALLPEDFIAAKELILENVTKCVEEKRDIRRFLVQCAHGNITKQQKDEEETLRAAGYGLTERKLRKVVEYIGFVNGRMIAMLDNKDEIQSAMITEVDPLDWKVYTSDSIYDVENVMTLQEILMMSNWRENELRFMKRGLKPIPEMTA